MLLDIVIMAIVILLLFLAFKDEIFSLWRKIGKRKKAVRKREVPKREENETPPAEKTVKAEEKPATGTLRTEVPKKKIEAPPAAPPAEKERIAETAVEKKVAKELPGSDYPDFDNSRLLGLGLSQADADAFTGELIEQIEDQIPKIEEAISNRAFDQIERLSHSIKGSATNIGTGGVADVLVDFNTYAKTGKDMDIITAHFENLKNYQGKLKKQFPA